MIRLMRRSIDRARQRSHPTVKSAGKQDRLKLLFAGYTGAYNMGSDVRVEEMIRQVSHILGPDRIEASVFRFEDPKANSYFGDSEKLQPEVLFPLYLSRIVPEFDGVIACEGSMFKSKLTDLFSSMMVGSLGLASAAGKISIAYGAEAGDMSPRLTKMVEDYCGESYIITRNEASQTRLNKLGLDSDVGTDTAWTFSPLPREYGEWELRKQGWRGEPVLMVCPMNPFWWPAHISIMKRLARTVGFYKKSHYARVFFFQSGKEIDRQLELYLQHIARSVKKFCREKGYFPVVVASEQIDRFAMKRLSDMLGGTPTFNSFDYHTCQFVSILRCAKLMVTSRYHAAVTTMAGGVVSAGVSMDERLDNLMADRGHDKLLASVDDPNLSDRLDMILEHMHSNHEQLREETRMAVVRNLRIMSKMGKMFLQHVISKRPEVVGHQSMMGWENYLPPLDGTLHQLLEDHGDVRSAPHVLTGRNGQSSNSAHLQSTEN